MKVYVYSILLALFLGTALVGCSDVGFNSVPRITCAGVSRDQSATCHEGPTGYVTVSYTFSVGDVDILFVDDNSGSMFVEQAKMANAFPNFFNRISNLFYNIAIITTDVSASPGNSAARAANGNGAFQDGKFLEFTDESGNHSGLKVIKQTTPNAEALFRGTIKRQESLNCDQSNYNAASCPSQDERGIYAANLAIARGEAGFFRPGAHLAIVVLSDEDERGEITAKNGQGIPTMSTSGPIDVSDLPQTLISNLKTYYPTKSMSVHSIVTNDNSCQSQQTFVTPFGYKVGATIGEQYMILSEPWRHPSLDLTTFGNIMTGSIGTICASDYGAQLSNIGNYVANNTMNSPKQLACGNPTAMTVLTNPTGYESQIGYSIDGQNRITFSNLPLGVQVTFSYNCPK